MMEEEKKSTLEVFFSDAFVLALITVLAYWFAFAFESHYLDVFEIPPHLVHLQFDSIFTSMVYLYPSFESIIVVFLFLGILWLSKPHLKRTIVILLLLFAWPLVQFFVYGFGHEVYLSSIVSLFIVAICSVIIYFKREEGQTFRDSLITYSSKVSDALFLTNRYDTRKIFGPGVFFLILYMGSPFVALMARTYG